MPLSVDAYLDGAEAWLTVRGEIDIATRPDLVKALDAAFTGEAERVVVDLSGVTFMDCYGMSALIHGWHESARRSRGYLLVGATGVPLLVLRVTGVLDEIG